VACRSGSFLRIRPDTKQILAGGCAGLDLITANDGGASWTRQNDPKLPDRGKAPFRGPGYRFARHPGRPNEIYAALRSVV